MDIARKVIKRIVSNTELTSSANFGLMEWGHPYRSIRWFAPYRYDTWRYNYYGTRIRVPVSPDGAKKIFTDVDNVFAGGGTYLAPALNIAKIISLMATAVFHLQEFQEQNVSQII